LNHRKGRKNRQAKGDRSAWTKKYGIRPWWLIQHHGEWTYDSRSI